MPTTKYIFKKSTRIRKSFYDWMAKYKWTNLFKTWRPWIFEQKRLSKISCII